MTTTVKTFKKITYPSFYYTGGDGFNSYFTPKGVDSSVWEEVPMTFMNTWSDVLWAEECLPNREFVLIEFDYTEVNRFGFKVPDGYHKEERRKGWFFYHPNMENEFAIIHQMTELDFLLKSIKNDRKISNWLTAICPTKSSFIDQQWIDEWYNQRESDLRPILGDYYDVVFKDKPNV